MTSYKRREFNRHLLYTFIDKLDLDLLEDAETEIAKLQQSLGRSDALIGLRNQEISALNSRLALRDETIAELGEQIDTRIRVCHLTNSVRKSATKF